MRLLFIGGTGIISTARTALAAEHGMDVTLLARGSSREDLLKGRSSPTADAPIFISSLGRNRSSGLASTGRDGMWCN
jgi:hypothetical protein